VHRRLGPGTTRYPATEHQGPGPAPDREDARRLGREHRRDGRGAREAGEYGALQSAGDSQAEAVRGARRVGLRLQRAARRDAGESARPFPQRQRVHDGRARAQRQHPHGDDPRARHRQLRHGGAVHGVERQSRDRGRSRRGDRAATQHRRAGGRAGARLQRAALQEPVRAGARPCTRRSTWASTASSPPTSAPPRATP